METEVAPTYATYFVKAKSGEKDLEFTVIDNKGKQEIISVRSPSELQSTPKPEQPTTTKSIDENGNNVVITNDANLI